MSSGWKRIRGVIRRAFTDNLGLKLVALVITLVLFFFVNLQERVERWIDVEVNVRRPPETAGVVLTSETPDTVRVFLRGRPSMLKAVKQGAMPQVVMDISARVKPGSFTFNFEPEMFEFSEKAVEVVAINPEAVLVRVERVVTRNLPVRVKTIGRLKTGTELVDEPLVDPPDVLVSGAASAVRALSELETEAVDVEGLGVGSHQFKVPLRRVEGIHSVRTSDLAVTLKVRWTPGQRMLSSLLVRAVGTDQPVEIQPSEVAVSLTGPQVALDKIDLGAVVPEVDLTEEMLARPGSQRAEVQIKGLPADIKVGSIAPRTVTIKVRAGGR